MTAKKEKQLNETYQNYIQALVNSKHIDKLDEFIVENVMGYGTAIDEKIHSISDFQQVIERTKEQSAGIDMSFELTPVFRRVSPDEDAAIIVEELKIIMLIDADRQELFVRITSVLEYIDKKWMAVHCHASIAPDISENDAWHVNEWQRKNEELKKLVDERTNELKKSLEELKAAQAQIIQSEKMASLGELTAGIAHEIQNPLNFVNNFSEVNTELIDEMQQELKAGNNDEAITISNNIKENQEKINHHGKRADAIVKGMLQHSRSSSGVKEPTDINSLVDEYLRLAYHGLRAKDKSFNAKFETHFDASLEKINIVPQDIGRVILNLITNAFYAVTEKKKAPQPPPAGGGVEYEPVVTVTTKRLGSPPTGGDGGVEVRVKDNGNGIPQKVLDKIFQPFFTTKPTGQGTGLGLSLSYDIIKAHGGELKVETKEGKDLPAGEAGAEFIIQLPMF